MNTAEVINNNGYLLNKWGYGGLGRIYIDVLSSGHIQLRSYSLDDNPSRRSYLITIKVDDRNPEIVLENSINGGNYNFEKPASNRPGLYDIQRVLTSMPDNFQRDNQDLSLEISNYIQTAFES